MQIRPYTPSDREKVLRLREAHGKEYVFPDPDDRLNIGYFLLEDDDGELLGASVARLTVEGFVLINKRRGTPQDRWSWVRAVIEAGTRWAYNTGLGEHHFWVHPKLRSFARRMAGIPGVHSEHRHSFTVDLKERYTG